MFLSAKEFLIFLIDSYLPKHELPIVKPENLDDVIDMSDFYEIVLLPTHSIITDLCFIEPGDKVKLRDKIKGINYFKFIGGTPS